jgi:hypothetical protein
MVKLEELGTLKISTSSGTQTTILLACSIVPQPTMLSHAPLVDSILKHFFISEEGLYSIIPKLTHDKKI